MLTFGLIIDTFSASIRIKTSVYEEIITELKPRDIFYVKHKKQSFDEYRYMKVLILYN